MHGNHPERNGAEALEALLPAWIKDGWTLLPLPDMQEQQQMHMH
jgi:hypothetical protein